jgi:hypothetical protein
MKLKDMKIPLTLDLSAYIDGNYILSVENEGRAKQIQIVKQ